jgi:hypothetical protein
VLLRNDLSLRAITSSSDYFGAYVQEMNGAPADRNRKARDRFWEMSPPGDLRDATEIASDNAEDFKQGAKIARAQLVGESAWALCLKSRCAKPLQHASSYVF